MRIQKANFLWNDKNLINQSIPLPVHQQRAIILFDDNPLTLVAAELNITKTEIIEDRILELQTAREELRVG